MSRYVNLATAGTNYAKRMNRLSNRIFGEVVRTTNQPSMKVVKLFTAQPLNERKDIVEYYPRHVEIGKLMMRLRYYGLFRDEHQDFKEEMVRLRALRGKVKPVKEKRKKEEE